MTKKEFCLKGRIFVNTLKRKQNEFFKVNTQHRKDYLEMDRKSWERGNSDIALYETHKDWSCIGRISGLINLTQDTVKKKRNYEEFAVSKRIELDT